MRKKQIYLLSTGLILVALALVVTGLQRQSAGIWGAGLAVITVAMLLSLASRWLK